jgi:hypothetical protein
MYGIYLKCEHCGTTIGGEDVTPKQQGIPTLTRWQGRELRERAAQRGWTHEPPDGDLCPECSEASSTKSATPEAKEKTMEQVDRSDAADAKRMRWLLDGNGYFMEEERLCGHKPCDEDEQDHARRLIDQEMASRP